jgi:hypothetical protein
MIIDFLSLPRPPGEGRKSNLAYCPNQGTDINHVFRFFNLNGILYNSRTGIRQEFLFLTERFQAF